MVNESITSYCEHYTSKFQKTTWNSRNIVEKRTLQYRNKKCFANVFDRREPYKENAKHLEYLTDYCEIFHSKSTHNYLCISIRAPGLTPLVEI